MVALPPLFSDLTQITSGTLFIAAFEKSRYGYRPVYRPSEADQHEASRPSSNKITASSQEAVPHACGQDPGQSPLLRPCLRKALNRILRKFCTNFTDDAKAGKIDPILGRDDEISNAIDILSRRRKNNPILVGEAGVGKTAIVEGLALRIAAGDVPDHLKNVTSGDSTSACCRQAQVSRASSKSGSKA